MTGALIIATGKTDHQSAFAPERQIGRISALEPDGAAASNDRDSADCGCGR